MEANAVQKTHPLIIVAAASVTALSLAGVGAILGLVPTNGANRADAPVAAMQAVAAPPPAAPAAAARSDAPPTLSLPAGSSVKIETPREQPRRPVAVAKPQPKPEVVYVDRPVPANPGQIRVAHDEPPSVYAEAAERAPRYEPPEARRVVAPPTCRDCGTIADIRQIARAGDPNGIGAVAGGLLGGVVGRQVGNGRGRDVMTVLGAVGGAYAGHQIEKSQRGTNDYEITVRFDDGTTQVFTQATPPVWRQGERIRVSSGQIAAL